MPKKSARFFGISRLAVLVLSLCVAASLTTRLANAGPPFRTDDPEPIDYQHTEVYLFSTGTHAQDGTTGLGPAIEANYGALPDVHLHAIVPFAFNAPNDEPSHFGFGDLELGVKYRFIHQKTAGVDVGVFPLVEVPTGDETKGLGNGRAQYFLPVWLQKDFDKWSVFGGGGYWINPGPDNRNFWFTGVAVTREITEGLYLGAELFHQAANTVDGKDSTGFNVGGGIKLIDELQLLVSVGSGLRNNSTNRVSYYVGLYYTF